MALRRMLLHNLGLLLRRRQELVSSLTVRPALHEASLCAVAGVPANADAAPFVAWSPALRPDAVQHSALSEDSDLNLHVRPRPHPSVFVRAKTSLDPTLGKMPQPHCGP